jgi:hypothetical protein
MVEAISVVQLELLGSRMVEAIFVAQVELLEPGLAEDALLAGRGSRLEAAFGGMFSVFRRFLE